MLAYTIRRSLQSIPLLFIISIITFMLMTLAPGDPTAMFENPEASSRGAQDFSVIREKLGLDQPIYIQYAKWLKLVVLEGNMGYSFEDSRPVLEKIIERIPATFVLMGTATILSFIIAMFIGILSAIKKYSVTDSIFTFSSFFGISVPTFYLALIGILFLSSILGWFPVSDMRSNFDTFDLKDRLYHLILPSFVISFGLVAQFSRYMRSSMLEVIKQDYIRTARAKGLPNWKVILKHAIRNAMLPMITLIGLELPSLFAGAFITENIFAWPGMGRLSINAIFIRDYQVIMGVTMVTAALVVLGNLIADILYAVVDPRIQYGKN
jgi:peptide/nickel transport system permease protein